MDTVIIEEGDENKEYPYYDIRTKSKKLEVIYKGGNKKHFFTVRDEQWDTEADVIVSFSSTSLNQQFAGSRGKPDKFIIAALRYIIKHYERLGE